MDTLIYQIALSLIKGIGPKLARNIIAYLGSVEAFFEDKKLHLDKISGIGEVIASSLNAVDKKELLNRANIEVDFIRKNNLRTFFFADKSFPKRLSYCEDAPIIFYSNGNVDFDSQRMISIVGTRKPTDYGTVFCDRFINELTQAYPKTVIVSGLAYGVDIHAHRAALRNNLPTIAVLAHGLDRIYPGVHSQTAREMVSNGGALVSEFMTKTQPDKPNFVRRNRIVAGLSDATLVIESAKKGGALITAGIANSYNRDVFALPGRANDEYSAGCNRLIRNNQANLFESLEDIEYILGWERNPKNKVVQKSIFAQPDTPEEKAIMDILLVEKEVNLNILAMKCGMHVGKISANLLELEFKGLVKSCPGSIYKLI